MIIKKACPDKESTEIIMDKNKVQAKNDLNSFTYYNSPVKITQKYLFNNDYTKSLSNFKEIDQYEFAYKTNKNFNKFAIKSIARDFNKNADTDSFTKTKASFHKKSYSLATFQQINDKLDCQFKTNKKFTKKFVFNETTNTSNRQEHSFPRSQSIPNNKGFDKYYHTQNNGNFVYNNNENKVENNSNNNTVNINYNFNINLNLKKEDITTLFTNQNDIISDQKQKSHDILPRTNDMKLNSNFTCENFFEKPIIAKKNSIPLLLSATNENKMKSIKKFMEKYVKQHDPTYSKNLQTTEITNKPSKKQPLKEIKTKL